MTLFLRFLFLFILSLTCLSSPAAYATPHILVTIKPLHALVSSVTEGVTEPDLLLEKNASPHSYTLRPNDLEKLQHADIIFQVGPEFEVFLQKALASSKAENITVSHFDGLTSWPIRKEHIWEEDEDEHDHHAGTIDTHLWLDPNNAIVIVNHVAEILAANDAEHATIYRQNAAKMVRDITALDKELAQQLAPYHTKPYLVSHDAYQYFEKHYHLAGVGAITLTPDQAPGAKTIARLQAIAAERGAVCLFSEPQFPDSFIHLIADKTGIGTGILDAEWGALKTDHGKEAYFTMMRGLGRNMVNCFNQQARHSLMFEQLDSNTAPTLSYDTLLSHEGKTLFLFWRTDCAPCLEEMNHLPQLANTYKDLKINVVALQGKQQAAMHKPEAMPANVTLLTMHGTSKTEDVQAYLRAFGSTAPALPFSAMMHGEELCATHHGILALDLMTIWNKTC